MCGYVGYLVDKKTKISTGELNVLHYMTDIITHRGPDNKGIHFDSHIRFGFRRLSIVDIESGHQPLSYDDGRYWIVFNGEIYNHVELRKELEQKGFNFKTNSDTEVLLALYACEKTRMVHQIRGMFSFFIWDYEEEILFGARDPFGIKPLFYLEKDDTLYFASEKKSLFAIDEFSEVNSIGVQHYLTYQYVPEPYSATANIKTLEPGHFLLKKIGQPIALCQYWVSTFEPTGGPEKESEEELIEIVRDALEQSVELHMRSDVPVGAFLSGGIDSSFIAALAKRTNPNLKTFTVGFEMNGYSEIEVAKETADALGVEHYSYVITPEEFITELPKIIWHMDDPIADPAAIPLYFVAREARKQVKVVLSGEGADELFAGYNIYREPFSLKWFNHFPQSAKRILKNLALTFPHHLKGKGFLLRGCTPIEERYIGNAKIFLEEEKKILLRNYNPNSTFEKITRNLYDSIPDYDDTKKMQYIDIHTWLRGDILAKADRMTMANSLELRVPFLDTTIFDIASTIPTSLNLKNGNTKYILRQAAKGIVPEQILNRKKLGFPVPISHWLRNKLYEWALNVIINSEVDYMLKKDYVLELLEQHKQNLADHGRKLWVILVFIIWHEIFLEEKYSFRTSENVILDAI